MVRPPPGALLRQAVDGADDDARVRSFIDGYWGRRPLSLPRALDGFEVPLDADELAGLACEPGADARIVRTTADGYRLETGPFDAARFDALGDRDWTLLVNAVDLAIPGFEPLLEAVRFLPDWRLDDVMVSFAAPGGTVGPHLDRYDVFLLQASGHRNWALGPDPGEETRENEEVDGLSLVRGFSSVRTVECGPGDGLYVPPGCIHHGIARTPCMTISVGLRSPSIIDLLEDWVLARMDAADATPLDLDPELPTSPALLADRTIDLARSQLRTALLEGLDDARFETRLGTLLTEASRGAAFEEPDPIDAADLERELADGALLERAPGVRLLLRAGHGCTQVFAAGQAFSSEASTSILEPLTRLTPLTARDLRDPALRALAAELYNRGLLMLTEGDA